jgi:hypothetical protein
MGGEPCPTDVRHPLGVRAVVAMPDRMRAAGCSDGSTGLVPSALRATAQLASPTSTGVVVGSGTRAGEESDPAALRSACPRNLVDREDREEHQCGQEGRGSSHSLLQLPLHMGLLQSRAFRRLRVLEEGAWCVREEWWCARARCCWVGTGRALSRRCPPQQHTAEHHRAQVRAAFRVWRERLALAEEPRRPAPPEGEREQVCAGAGWASGATSARRCPCARARHSRLDASAKSSDLAGVGELVRKLRGDVAGEVEVEEEGDPSK